MTVMHRPRRGMVRQVAPLMKRGYWLLDPASNVRSAMLLRLYR